MLPKRGEEQEAHAVAGLKQAIRQQVEQEEQSRRRKAKLNLLHSLYYTYKLRFNAEPKNVYEMIKGVVYLLEG